MGRYPPDVVPMSPTSRPNSGQSRHHFARTRPISRPMSGKSGPTLAHHFGQNSAALVRARPASATFGQTSAKLVPKSAKFGESWFGIYQSWRDFGRRLIESAEFGQNAWSRPDLGRHPPDMVIPPTSTESGPEEDKLGAAPAEFWPNSNLAQIRPDTWGRLRLRSEVHKLQQRLALVGEAGGMGGKGGAVVG